MNMTHALLVVALLITAPIPVACADDPAPPDECEAQWEATFGGRPGMNSSVWALTSAGSSPDGGPALYAGGSFIRAGGVNANRIARWDGSEWSSLGDGMNGLVRALAIATAEHGEEEPGIVLYAGGTFSQAGGNDAAHISMWNGSEWSNVGAGTNGPIKALVQFPAVGESGPLLIAGGEFSVAGDVAAANIAAWNGTRWSPLGSGLNGDVLALAVYDDASGEGPALYAAGSFALAGDTAVNGIAKWNGKAWSPLDRGLDGSVYTMSVFDDGTGDGAALYAGGNFFTAGDVSASRIARWDGHQWTRVGDGLTGAVTALTVHDDGRGNGPLLYAAGQHLFAGDPVWAQTARWDGSEWSAGNDGFITLAWALASFDAEDGAGSALFAGGFFNRALLTESTQQEMSYVSQWRGDDWKPVGAGFSGLYMDGDLTTEIHALTTFDDGSGDGEALYAGGWFASVGSVSATCIAKWNGREWSPLSSGMNYGVYDIVTFDDGLGEGPALYAGGLFTTAGGVEARGVARWDGEQWSSVGSGIGPEYAGRVLALAVFDDGKGDGPALIAGGPFSHIGDEQFNYIAKWDGTQWSPLASGMNDIVWALATFDDGNGSAIYAAGDFTQAGGAPANRIAKWDGTQWSSLDSGIGGASGSVRALVVFDDGTHGPALYAGGWFSEAGGVATGGIARWDGTQWSALGSAFSPPALALSVFDDGSGAGPSLIAGGNFSAVDGITMNGIARWNGASWSALGEGVEVASGPFHGVLALTVFDDERSDAPALFASGNFETSAAGDRMLAKWQGCAVPAVCDRGDLNCDGVIDGADLLLLLSAWGQCSSCDTCEADLDGDCVVGYSDLLELLGIWGAG